MPQSRRKMLQKLETITLNSLQPGKFCFSMNSGSARCVLASIGRRQAQCVVGWAHSRFSIARHATPSVSLPSELHTVDRTTMSSTGESTRCYPNKLKLMDENWLLRVWRTILILVFSCGDDNEKAFVWAKYASRLKLVRLVISFCRSFLICSCISLWWRRLAAEMLGLSFTCESFPSLRKQKVIRLNGFSRNGSSVFLHFFWIGRYHSKTKFVSFFKRIRNLGSKRCK